jgi:ArsR family transcriptional regulator
MKTAATVFDRMTALADSLRSRTLLLLERHELTVSELCTILQLPQSTTSRHLKILGDEGWVVSRAEGTSRRYSMGSGRLDSQATALWALVREQIADTDAARQDAARLESVLAERRSASRAFFSTAAGSWDRMREEMFGERTDVVALLALLDDDWTIGDLGCGTGTLTASIAPFVRRVIAVDESDAMLGAARARLDGFANVELKRSELESLPVRDGELDAAILCLVLHYQADPARVLAEARRVLRRGGRLLVIDMTPHDHDEYRQLMGHVWQGIGEQQLAGWMAEAGFERVRYRALPADPAAKGPTLFAAVGSH